MLYAFSILQSLGHAHVGTTYGWTISLLWSIGQFVVYSINMCKKKITMQRSKLSYQNYILLFIVESRNSKVYITIYGWVANWMFAKDWNLVECLSTLSTLRYTFLVHFITQIIYIDRSLNLWLFFKLLEKVSNLNEEYNILNY